MTLPAVSSDDEHTSWTGRWVTDRLGVDLQPAQPGRGLDVADLVGLALRRNPRRAHLLVSVVLGKHVPADPREVSGTGLLLGQKVKQFLHEQAGPRDTSSLVLGFAETATALGHFVADALLSPYLHSTRRAVAGYEAAGRFEEEHSHATSHLLLPADHDLLRGREALVLVDDELSTGRTALNTIVALHEVSPRSQYVVATLVDLRSDADRAEMAAVARRLGSSIEVVSLAAARLSLPADVLARGVSLCADLDILSSYDEVLVADGPLAHVVRLDIGWPKDLREGARHGFTSEDRARLDARLPHLAARLAAAVVGPPDARHRRVLVLGFEELMYAPIRLAQALAESLDARSDVSVFCSSTTRSPVMPVDDPGYPIRTRLSFRAHDDAVGSDPQRYAYNVAAGADPTRRFDTVVLVVDSEGDSEALQAPDGLLEQLRRVTDEVFVVVLPTVTATATTPARTAPGRFPPPLRGPDFGSYAPDDVAWLLTDLSGAPLEAPAEEREEAVQVGGAHYAESLPIEYQPTPEYQQLFEQALNQSSVRLARAVGIVTEIVLDSHGPNVVLASLARAGTPVGILMRRWAHFSHGLDLAHYALSIVRGRGIDELALRYLAANHDPARVQFVDGWTGKGAITRELANALRKHELSTGTSFSADLAVVADTGSCTTIFGTREDYLIPSACLNSTVSGLVSRTVLNEKLIGTNDFHGAKFYAELADADMSQVFLDRVVAQFPAVAGDVAQQWSVVAHGDRTPTWAGWTAVERIRKAYGVEDVNLVKPGVGETTRVLLRRMPWKILAHADAGSELALVRLLAEQRGVPVEVVDDLPFSCVGLIQPRLRPRTAAG